MPFARKTLAQLRAETAQDIAAAVPGTDPLLRFSNLQILGAVQAGFSHLHYGYLDWIAKQSNPATCTDEYLEMWAALVNVFRLAPTSASGSVTFTGTDGKVITAGSVLVRSDGVEFTTAADVTVASGTAVVVATANADPAGKTGAFGNTANGSPMTLAVPISGVAATGTVTTAFTGGADIEGDESLRTRMFKAFQNPPQGGSKSDYEGWALSVPGVTRAWIVPSGMGPGTVVVYFMTDVSEAAYDGFPQGSNGVATDETRDTAATGDQLTLANYLFGVQPVTALVYGVAPSPNPIDFTIAGLSTASTATKNAVKAAIADAFKKYGVPGETFDLSYVNEYIVAVPLTTGYVIDSPSTNITNGAGELPTLGVVTFP